MAVTKIVKKFNKKGRMPNQPAMDAANIIQNKLFPNNHLQDIVDKTYELSISTEGFGYPQEVLLSMEASWRNPTHVDSGYSESGSEAGTEITVENTTAGASI